MEQIAMYLRLSKEDEFIRDESNSITNQRAFIREFINKDKAFGNRTFLLNRAVKSEACKHVFNYQ